MTPVPDGLGPVNIVRSLVTLHGHNSTSWQILNNGFRYWTWPEANAVVGYVLRGRTVVAAGEPISAPDDLADVSYRFEEECYSAGYTRVCWFCASDQFRRTRNGQSKGDTLEVGAQPVWDPAHWVERVNAHPSLRAQLNRAANKGVAVEEWDADSAARNNKLRTCLNRWLETRPIPPLHFLTEAELLNSLDGRRVFVATRKGIVVGFVLLSPIPRRDGWLVEQFVRDPDAPNGTMELLLNEAVTTLARDQYSMVTLGLAPLSEHGGELSSELRSIRFLIRLLRKRGSGFYNFVGLDRFKAKFMPDRWEPIYLLTSRKRASVSALYSVASAFSVGSPVLVLIRGLLRRVRFSLPGFRPRVR